MADFPESLVDAVEISRLDYSDRVDRLKAWWSDRDVARAATVGVLRALAEKHKGALDLYKTVSAKRFVEWADELEAKTGE